MTANGYVSLLSLNGSNSHTAVFSPAKGGETAGSVAASFPSSSAVSQNKETSGHTAGSFTGQSSSSSSCCSFSAVA